MADREKLINRINKLLALADNNSNENEAQAAWNKAFALMKENNIAFREVTMPGSEDDDFSWWPEEDDDDDSSEFEDDEDLSWESEYEATRERARRYAEAKAQQEAYERGKQEAEARIRRENEERARREAEARQAAAERARRDAEARAQQEACRQAQMRDTEQKEEAVERSGTPKEEQSAQNINQANNARVDSETTDTLADGETFEKEAGIKKYFVFSGRLGRKSFAIRIFVIMLIRIIQTTVVDLGFVDDGGRVFSDALNSPIFVVAIITSFITLFAKYAAINRRFHDLNRSSIWTWCLFFLWKGTNRNSDAALVMFGIEIIALIVLCFIEGTKGENKYGPEPQ